MRIYILSLGLLLSTFCFAGHLHQHAHSGAQDIAPHLHQHRIPKFTPNMNRHGQEKEVQRQTNSHQNAHQNESHYSNRASS